VCTSVLCGSWCCAERYLRSGSWSRFLLVLIQQMSSMRLKSHLQEEGNAEDVLKRCQRAQHRLSTHSRQVGIVPAGLRLEANAVLCVLRVCRYGMGDARSHSSWHYLTFPGSACQHPAPPPTHTICDNEATVQQDTQQ
jgi:hypothetical protein